MLTTNGLIPLIRRIEGTTPTLQIITYKHVQHNQHETLFEMMLSDGDHCTTAVFLQPDDLLLGPNYLVKILDYSYQRNEFLVITGLDVVGRQSEMIGDPQELGIGDDVDEKVAHKVTNVATNVTNAPPQRTATSRTSYHSINLLTPYEENWFITARLTLKDEVKNLSKNDRQFMILNVNFGDNSGEIRASLFDDAIKRWGSILEVGRVYKITGISGSIKCVQKRYSSVPCEYQLELNEKCGIEPVHDDGTIKMRHDYPKDITEILDLPSETYIDFIGVVDSVDDAKPIGQKGTLKKTVYLTDNTNRKIQLSLWGKTSEMDFPLKEVILFKNLKVNEWKESKSLNYTYAAHYEIIDQSNADSIEKGREMLMWAGESSGGTFLDVSRPSSNTYKDASNESSDWKTIAQAKKEDLGRDGQATFWCSASITLIKNDADTKIYYEACPDPENQCKKKVIDNNDGTYHCPKCNVNYHKFIPRYSLRCVIADQTDSIWVRFFGDAEKVFGMTCEELVALNEPSTKDQFEGVFLDAKYKKFNVRVKCSPPYGESSYMSYSVEYIGEINFLSTNRRMAKDLVELLGE